VADKFVGVPPRSILDTEETSQSVCCCYILGAEEKIEVFSTQFGFDPRKTCTSGTHSPDFIVRGSDLTDQELIQAVFFKTIQRSVDGVVPSFTSVSFDPVPESNSLNSSEVFLLDDARNIAECRRLEQ